MKQNPHKKQLDNAREATSVPAEGARIGYSPNGVPQEPGPFERGYRPAVQPEGGADKVPTNVWGIPLGVEAVAAAIYEPWMVGKGVL